MEASIGPGPAGNGRSVASRRAPSVLEPSLGPATGKTTHRFGRASPHPAHGRGEPSLGRSADPRRAAEARNRRLGTHGVALSCQYPDGTLTDLAYISRHQLTTSSVTCCGAPDEDDGFDGCGVLPCSVSPSGEPSCVGDRWSVVHWPLSLHCTSAEERVGQAHVHHRTREHPSSGKDPPKAQAVALKRHISAAAPFVRSVHGAIGASKQLTAIASPGRWTPRAPRYPLSVQSRRQHRRMAATSCASRTAKRTCACHSDSSRSIGETQRERNAGAFLDAPDGNRAKPLHFGGDLSSS